MIALNNQERSALGRLFASVDEKEGHVIGDAYREFGHAEAMSAVYRADLLTASEIALRDHHADDEEFATIDWLKGESWLVDVCDGWKRASHPQKQWLSLWTAKTGHELWIAGARIDNPSRRCVRLLVSAIAPSQRKAPQ